MTVVLTLESGTRRALLRQHRIDVPVDGPDQPARRSLILQAAHTVFPEDGVESLPHLARAELTAGLDGPLRRSIAAAEPDDPALPEYRDQLVSALTGHPAHTGAIALTDHVHLARLVRGDAPPILNVGALLWYGAWRTPTDPHTHLVHSLTDLHNTWIDHPSDRAELETLMTDHAAAVVGHGPADPLDLAV